MNKYRSPNSTTVGTAGQMVNEGLKTEKQINYPHYGIYSNDNTYAVTFNPYMNRPPTKMFSHYPIKSPPTNQRITKTYNEPPVSITENNVYLSNAASKESPILPPYLNEPEDNSVIQGLSEEKNKDQIDYIEPITIDKKSIHY